jgi:hypothetical protein
MSGRARTRLRPADCSFDAAAAPKSSSAPSSRGYSGGSLDALMTGGDFGGVRERPLEDDHVTVLLFVKSLAHEHPSELPTLCAELVELLLEEVTT